jgi:alpha-L-rhamnosidase
MRFLNGFPLLMLLLMSSADAHAKLNIANLQCEYRVNPMCIDTREPRLSWVLAAKGRNQRPAAYQVLVASELRVLRSGRGDLWDSGKVASSDSLNIRYAGPRLNSGQRVYWLVRVWDAQGGMSQSKVAWWEMGLLEPSDWKGKWICGRRPLPSRVEEFFLDDPAPLFRKEFVVEKPVRRARAYVTGLGYYELRLNGKRVGDQVLDPGWTTYTNRVLYSTFDVTDDLRRGSNTLGAMLGNGWYNPLPLKMWGHLNLREQLPTGKPKLLMQLQLDYEDNTRQTICSDETWRTADGPVIRNSVYLGEWYDARREQPGWDGPGFNDSTWEPALAAKDPIGRLRIQQVPPIRITRTLKAQRLTEPRPGVYIFDFGQNFAGWVRLQARGQAGTRIKLRYGELLYPDGTLNGMTAVCAQIKAGGTNYVYEGDGPPKTAWQQDEYVLRGSGRESWTPRFTFHGFRYVEVTGYPGKPHPDALTGLRLNSDVAKAGSFECSNPLLNRIQQLVLWTELSNLFSVESDCPHREKFGYGGDIVAASEMAILNFDMSRFYAKAVEDLGDAVRPNGGFTETAPSVGLGDQGLGGGSAPVGWGTAQPWLLWKLYQYYGDRRLIEENFELTRGWVKLLQARAVNGILDNGISDHESLVPKPRALTGTAFYYLNVQLLAKLARVLNKEQEAAEAEQLGQSIKAAFNQRFLQTGTGRYDTASQACQAFALYAGLVPEQEKSIALDLLLEDIRNHQNHLTTGIFGTQYMLDQLTSGGHAETAYDLVNQRTFPGWGFMVENGATTLWEHWEFSDNTYSHNHPMFGSVSEWFYKGLAGIEAAPDAVGLDHVIIAPHPVHDLKWAKGRYDSVRGPITSEWRRSGKQFTLWTHIPVGVRGTILLPGRITGAASGQGPNNPIEVGSGNYKFKCELRGSYP